MSGGRLFRHLASGRLYRFVGSARDAECPTRKVVLYAQTSASMLRHTRVVLPRGTMWVRDVQDFRSKFRRATCDASGRGHK